MLHGLGDVFGYTGKTRNTFFLADEVQLIFSTTKLSSSKI
jgi:hypothetical protein